MKLRNKISGNILNEVRSSMTYKDNIRLYDETSDKYYSYNSLAELNEEWEDYEEPKDFWFIIACEPTEPLLCDKKVAIETMKQIGNYFGTREEAEKAVEKLKAWKRLKDNGLVIKKWSHTPDMHLTTGSFLKIEGFIPAIMKNMKDLDLLFGDEE